MRRNPNTLDGLISMMLGAETVEEMDAAEAAAVRWMRQRPEDREAVMQAEEALETKRRGPSGDRGAARDHRVHGTSHRRVVLGRNQRRTLGGNVSRVGPGLGVVLGCGVRGGVFRVRLDLLGTAGGARMTLASGPARRSAGGGRYYARHIILENRPSPSPHPMRRDRGRAFSWSCFSSKHTDKSRGEGYS